MFFFSQIYVDPSLVLSLFSFPSFSKSSFVAHFLAFRMKIRLANFPGEEEFHNERVVGARRNWQWIF